MVVDDDPGVRLTLEGIIEDEGYDVVGVPDGYRAIELAGQQTFALIFMDIKMPGIDGLDTYRKIKRVSPEAVVVMMTGFSVEDLVKEALDEGAYAVIYKPFDMEQIIDIVQVVLKTVLVLVVDDRAADRTTLRAMLEDNEYLVAEAWNGHEAAAMAAERHYGVILMDIRMPGMDGFATFQRISVFDRYARVIFITGYDLEEPVKEALLGGAYTVLAKPVDPDEMLALMKSIAG